LSAQYQAALWVNKKLNDELPVENRTYVWDPSSGTQPNEGTKSKAPKSAATPKQETKSNSAKPVFDTSVDLSDVDVDLKTK